jgi:hypothetical protein
LAVPGKTDFLGVVMKIVTGGIFAIMLGAMSLIGSNAHAEYYNQHAYYHHHYVHHHYYHHVHYSHNDYR